jgi:hypothetical protein
MKSKEVVHVVGLVRELWPALEWPQSLWDAFTSEIGALGLPRESVEQTLTALRLSHRWRTIEPGEILHALRVKLPKPRTRERQAADAQEILRRARHLWSEDSTTFEAIARRELKDEPRVPAHFWESPSMFAEVWTFAERILRAWPAGWKPPERTRSWSEVAAAYRAMCQAAQEKAQQKAQEKSQDHAHQKAREGRT